MTERTRVFNTTAPWLAVAFERRALLHRLTTLHCCLQCTRKLTLMLMTQSIAPSTLNSQVAWTAGSVRQCHVFATSALAVMTALHPQQQQLQQYWSLAALWPLEQSRAAVQCRVLLAESSLTQWRVADAITHCDAAVQLVSIVNAAIWLLQ
jgi:hypothetical protein